MKIKNHIWGWNHWMGSASLGLLIVSIALVIGLPRLGQTSPIPGLSAALTSSNTLLLTVTNGVSTEYYTVYSKAALQTNFSWSGSITGALGQTNFTVPLGPGLSGFFKAESGTEIPTTLTWVSSPSQSSLPQTVPPSTDFAHEKREFEDPGGVFAAQCGLLYCHFDGSAWFSTRRTRWRSGG